jgi:hypothetical protein
MSIKPVNALAPAGTVVDGPSGSTGGKVQLNGMEYDKVTIFDLPGEVLG